MVRLLVFVEASVFSKQWIVLVGDFFPFLANNKSVFE